MSGVSEQNISDDKLIAATGKPRDAWYALLDAESATGWTHTKIARWLSGVHGVDGWWAQGVAVGYEQARGMRLPGQLADGTFSASSSRTLDGTQLQLLDRVITVYSRAAGAEPGSVSSEAKHPTARWKLEDGSSVLATVSPGGGGKSRVALTRLKLRDPEQLEPAKRNLAKVLDEVASEADKSVD